MESEKTALSKGPVVPPNEAPAVAPVSSVVGPESSEEERPVHNEKIKGVSRGTKFVPNAALSSATAAQKPSLFTRRMFLVRLLIPSHSTATNDL